MNKRMRELQAQIIAKTAEAQGFMNGENKDIVKANAILDEVDALQKEFDTEERLLKAGKAGVPAEGEGAGEPKKDSIKALADAARSGFKSMNEGTLRTAATPYPRTSRPKSTPSRRTTLTLLPSSTPRR